MSSSVTCSSPRASVRAGSRSRTWRSPSLIRGRGIGRALVEAALALARGEARTELFVATAAADIGNLRFYQRLGFRMRSIERDAFTPATGYEPGLHVDGIELRDRVWLDRRP